MQTTRTPYSVSFMATVLLLLLFACHSTIANAAVALGATRVIYPANFIPTGVAMPYYHLRQNIEKIVSLLTRIPLQIMLNWMKP